MKVLKFSSQKVPEFTAGYQAKTFSQRVALDVDKTGRLTHGKLLHIIAHPMSKFRQQLLAQRLLQIRELVEQEEDHLVEQEEDHHSNDEGQSSQEALPTWNDLCHRGAYQHRTVCSRFGL